MKERPSSTREVVLNPYEQVVRAVEIFCPDPPETSSRPGGSRVTGIYWIESLLSEYSPKDGSLQHYHHQSTE